MPELAEKYNIKGDLEVTIRKFVEDPNGDTIAPVTKRRGYYVEQKQKIKNLLTKVGRDQVHTDMYTSATRTGSGFNFIALSSDATAPTADDTTLVGEITTGGLQRTQASTRSHTASTNTTTLQHTFTATAVHTNVQKSALFNSSTGGVLGHVGTFTAATLQIDDQIQITWTITAG